MTPRMALTLLLAGLVVAQFWTALGANPLAAETDSSIDVFIDGDPLQVEESPVIENGRTLIPMRAFFERLGAQVEWDQDERTALALRDGREVSIPIGSREPTVNGNTVSISVPARIINGRTFIPLRFVGESLGAEVQWNAEERTIYVTDEISGPDPKPEPDEEPDSDPGTDPVKEDELQDPGLDSIDPKPEPDSSLPEEQEQVLVDAVHREYEGLKKEINTTIDNQIDMLKAETKREIYQIEKNCRNNVQRWEPEVMRIEREIENIEKKYAEKIADVGENMAARGMYYSSIHDEEVRRLEQERDTRIRELEEQKSRLEANIANEQDKCEEKVEGLRSIKQEEIERLEQLREEHLQDARDWKENKLAEVRQ